MSAKRMNPKMSVPKGATFVFCLAIARFAVAVNCARTFSSGREPRIETLRDLLELHELGQLSGLGDAAIPDKVDLDAGSALRRLENLLRDGELKQTPRAKLAFDVRLRTGEVLVGDEGGTKAAAADPTFEGKYPIIFIPGLMGSQIEVRLNGREDPPNWFCRRTNKNWSRLWMIDTMHMLPELASCWLQDMDLTWNATSKTLDPSVPGIDSRATPGWDGAMKLDDKSPTLQPLADFLTTSLGYEAGRDMVAQSYDWRAGPETWMRPGNVYDQMKALIEKTVDSRPDREPIVAWSISLGGPFFSLFLSKHVTEAWKQEYIHAFFSVSGVMSGSVIAPYVSLAGTRFFQAPSWLKTALDGVAQSVSSVPWVFPHADAFGDAAIISTPERNYTAKDLGNVLDAVGNKQQGDLYRENLDLYGLRCLLPNVTTYCVTGYGVPTPETILYDENDLKGAQPTNMTMTSGDNCVPVASLRVCDDFGLHQKAPVFPYHMFNKTHAGLMYDPDVVSLFLGVITDVV